jgi:hypothetical protein
VLRERFPDTFGSLLLVCTQSRLLKASIQAWSEDRKMVSSDLFAVLLDSDLSIGKPPKQALLKTASDKIPDDELMFHRRAGAPASAGARAADRSMGRMRKAIDEELV